MMIDERYAMQVGGWQVGATVAEKDPGQPWTQPEIQQRIWNLEARADKQHAVGIVTLVGMAVGALTIIGIAAYLGATR